MLVMQKAQSQDLRGIHSLPPEAARKRQTQGVQQVPLSGCSPPLGSLGVSFGAPSDTRTVKRQTEAYRKNLELIGAKINLNWAASNLVERKEPQGHKMKEFYRQNGGGSKYIIPGKNGLVIARSP